jgi:hypothetical protein
MITEGAVRTSRAAAAKLPRLADRVKARRFCIESIHRVPAKVLPHLLIFSRAAGKANDRIEPPIARVSQMIPMTRGRISLRFGPN